MPTQSIDRFGGVLVRGVEAAPIPCPVACDLPRGYHVDPETLRITRDCDGLRICPAFEVRDRLRASCAGETNLIASAAYCGSINLFWIAGGVLRQPRARDHRELAEQLHKRGFQVGRSPAAQMLAQKLLIRAINRFGAPRSMTTAQAKRYFAGLSVTLQQPRERVLEACVDVGVVVEGGR